MGLLGLPVLAAAAYATSASHSAPISEGGIVQAGKATEAADWSGLAPGVHIPHPWRPRSVWVAQALP